MTVPAKITEFEKLLERQQPAIETALSSMIPAEKFVRVVLTHVKRTPKLLECSQASLLGSIMEAAQLGLSLEESMGEASIVPYKNMAKLIPGYRGLIKLACRSGHVSHMQARIFYENEYFQYIEGTDPRIDHQPLPPVERGEKRGAYSVAKLRDGETSFDLMWKEDIEKIKAKAPGASSSDSAWQTHPDEMWRKSVIRRHIKYLVLSTEMSDAVRTAVKDEYFDAGIVREPVPLPKATKVIEEEEPAAKVVEKEPPKEPKESPENSPTLFDENNLDLEAKIRELGEAVGMEPNDTEKRINNCKGNREKLNQARLELVREYNNNQKKR